MPRMGKISICLFDVTCKSVKETIPGGTVPSPQVPGAQTKIIKVSFAVLSYPPEERFLGLP